MQHFCVTRSGHIDSANVALQILAEASVRTSAPLESFSERGGQNGSASGYARSIGGPVSAQHEPKWKNAEKNAVRRLNSPVVSDDVSIKN